MLRPDGTERRSGIRRGKPLAAALALLVAAGVIVAVVLSAGSSGPGAAAGAAGAGSGLAVVQRRDLVETDTESGTISYSHPQTVFNRLTGTITWLPSVGQVIRPGGTLFRVDGEPVTLMDGTTPAYRTLSAADGDGPDVLALNRNLARLGFNADGIALSDVWQPGTTTGVELLQASLGEPQTGSLTLGQVVFLPGNQLVTSVEGTLGSTGGSGGGSGGNGVSATARRVAPKSEFVSLDPTATPQPGSPAPDSTEPLPLRHHREAKSVNPPVGHRRTHGTHGRTGARTLAALTALLKAESAQLRAEMAQLRAQERGGGSRSGSGGSGSSGNRSGGNAQAILQTSSTRLVVTVDLAASSQSEAAVGARVTVELPDSNIVSGRIIAVSKVAQSSSGNGSGSGSGNGSGNGNGNGGSGSSSSSSTIPVTIALDGRRNAAGLDQAAVSVNFAQQRARHVLSVPVTALLATSGGNYAVQEAAAPHRLLPVTTGLFAAGYVQISGPGIYAGLQVTDSQG